MPNAKTPDPDNREWTKADFAKAKRGVDVLPAAVLAAFGKPRGRPKLDQTKVAVKLRLDPEVVASYKAAGPGWQTRMNADLKKAISRSVKPSQPKAARRA